MIELVDYANQQHSTEEQIKRLYPQTSGKWKRDSWKLETLQKYIKRYYSVYQDRFKEEHPPMFDADMFEALQNIIANDCGLDEDILKYYMQDCDKASCYLLFFSKQSPYYIWDDFLRDRKRRPWLYPKTERKKFPKRTEPNS